MQGQFNEGTHEGNFVIEGAGHPLIEATEVTGVALDHTVFELYTGNRGNPRIGRGTFKVEEVVIRHANALNSFGEEAFAWMRALVKGQSGERRTFRVLIYDEDRTTVIAEWELRNCVPRRFELDGHNASGNNASYFKVTLRPEDMEMIAG